MLNSKNGRSYKKECMPGRKTLFTAFFPPRMPSEGITTLVARYLKVLINSLAI